MNLNSSESEDLYYPYNLKLNAYQISNLRWLLLMAYHKAHGGDVNLATGDWNGEILYKVEQLMIDNDIEYHPNVLGEINPPLFGWYGGNKTPHIFADKLANESNSSESPGS